jgi:TRAP transporter 4TM/12TM fusion protein
MNAMNSGGDEGQRMRTLVGKTALIVSIVAASCSLFFIYTGGFGQINMEWENGGYLLFSMFLCFLLYPSSKKRFSNRVSLVDWILSFLSVVAISYWMINYEDYTARAGNPNMWDLTMGGIAIVVIIEASRRVLGLVLPILAGTFLLYAYLGPYFPGELAHYGVSISRIIEYNAVSTGGMYGLVAEVASTYILPFIIFAAFIQKAGVGSAIEQLSYAIAGSSTGGPAKVAVVSSAIIGMVTGSSGANVVATGSYTIPMMKKAGYPAHWAAGVEGAASTGGQFMPPIMGASAFLIAEFTQTPYLEIIKVAAIPAILYFLGVFLMVHFIAAKLGLRGLPKEQLPKLKLVVLQKGYLLLPIFIILIVLVYGYSAQLAAFIAIISTIVLSFFRKETRLGPREIFGALVLGTKTALLIGATVGVIGLIVGIITMTGGGVKFSSFVVSFSGGYLFIAIILMGIAAYIIGMGVSITATYILVAVISVPAFVQLGVPLVAAHLACFWFSDLGGLTPPVCMVAYAASAIAGCDPYKAAFAGIRLAAPMLFMPFLFFYTPILLNGSTAEVFQAIITITIGTFSFAGMMQGYWFTIANLWERVLLGIATVLLFIPEIYTDILGISLILLVTYTNRRRKGSKFSEPRVVTSS